MIMHMQKFAREAYRNDLLLQAVLVLLTALVVWLGLQSKLISRLGPI